MGHHAHLDGSGATVRTVSLGNGQSAALILENGRITRIVTSAGQVRLLALRRAAVCKLGSKLHAVIMLVVYACVTKAYFTVAGS